MLDTELLRARTDSRRLMVVLHGLGDSMDGYRWLPDALGLPWMNYLLVNAPDRYFGGYAWYDFTLDPGPGIERSRHLLVSLVEAQVSRGFPLGEMTVFGFSQGCLMTLELGLRYSGRFAGLVGISGYAHELNRLIREMSSEARHQRFLITHGTLDPLIPFIGVRGQVEELQRSGLQIEWHEFPKAHTIHDEVELSVIRKFVRSCYEGSG